jgi:hypothetical protein
MCVDVRYYRAAATLQAESSTRASHGWKRIASAASWLLPSAALALMPKCPACFAAYFAAATGLGLSVSTAAHFRSATLVTCVLILLAVSLPLVNRVWHFRRI